MTYTQKLHPLGAEKIRENFKFFSNEICLAIIDVVDVESSTFEAEIFDPPKGRPVIVPYAHTGWSYVGGSGIIYIPQVGDIAILASIGKDYYPLGYTSIPILGGDEKGKEKESGKDTNYLKTATYQKGEGGKPKKPNRSCGMLRLPQGAAALLGPKGTSAVITNGRHVEMRSSEECSIELKGDSAIAGSTPIMSFFSLDAKFDYSSCLFEFERLTDRGSEKGNKGAKKNRGFSAKLQKKALEKIKGKTGTDGGGGDSTASTNTLNTQLFFKTTGRKEDKYYQITTGHHLDNKEHIREEALKKPDEKNSDTTNVDPSNDVGNKGFSMDGAIPKGGSSALSPKNTKPTSKGRNHNSLWKRVLKDDGEIIEASEENMEYQTQKDFKIFAKETLAFLSEKETLVYGKEDVSVLGEKNITVNSQDKILLTNQNVQMEFGDKIKVDKASNSEQKKLPKKTDGIL